MRVIVGLGNPGSRYEGTRHNVGFDLIDRLVARWHAVPSHDDPLMSSWSATVHDAPVELVKPQTFMNRSGAALVAALYRLDADATESLVIVDDMALDLGRLRFRARGSAGSHNGLASIEGALGTSEYPRLRVGVGPAPEAENWVDFVLGPFDDEEQSLVDETLDRAADGIDNVLTEGLERTMSRFNG